MNGANSPFAQLPIFSDYGFRVYFWAILGCLFMFFVLVELVRRGKLKERYSFLWFLMFGFLITFIVRRVWLEDLAALLGIYYPPTALLLMLAFFVLLILVHFSTVISKLLGDIQILAQKNAQLESRLKILEKQNKESPKE